MICYDQLLFTYCNSYFVSLSLSLYDAIAVCPVHDIHMQTVNSKKQKYKWRHSFQQVKKVLLKHLLSGSFFFIQGENPLQGVTSAFRLISVALIYWIIFWGDCV